MKAKTLPSYSRLRELFDYDQETGQLINKSNRSGVVAGSIAGCINSKGYIQIGIDNDAYLAHRLVWQWCLGLEPPDCIDHIDMDKANNRIENLRASTNALNRANTPHRGGQSGFKGVYQDGSKYRARMNVGGRTRNFGSYSTPELAHAAYCTAARSHYGEHFCPG